MTFLRALPFLLLALALGVAGFAVGALTDPFGMPQRQVVGGLDPEAPRLAEQLARANAEAADLAGQLEDARESRSELREELEAARAEIEQLRSRASAAEDARDNARQRGDELQARVDQLTAQVEQLQSRLSEMRQELERKSGEAPRQPSASAPGPSAQAEPAGDTANGDTADAGGQETQQQGPAADADTPSEARPAPSSLQAIDPTSAQGDRLISGVEAYQAGDYESAYRTWLPLAQIGYARAQLHLGGLFFEGRGVPQDDVLAFAWLTLAADNGSTNARDLLTRLRERMTAEQRAAAEALIRAAEQAS